MQLKSKLFKGAGPQTFFVLLFCALCCAPLFAAERYLSPDHPDGITLLPPPPAVGSEEEAADLASVRAVLHARTKAEEARAFADSSLGFAIFEPAVGTSLSVEKLPRTAALLKEVKQEIGSVIDQAKGHWKRRRPYQLAPELSVGKPEPSPSYPSGHSTRGTVYALVLAELFPERQGAILQVGRTIGWDRVIIGLHFPTDIYAGRTLGQAIMRELQASPSFEHDLAEAKAEIAAARANPGTPPPTTSTEARTATAAH